jgi:hypothetical protein
VKEEIYIVEERDRKKEQEIERDTAKERERNKEQEKRDIVKERATDGKSRERNKEQKIERSRYRKSKR